MMRKLFVLAILFLSAATTWAQTTEEGVLLQWKFKKGETIKYKQSVNMGMEISMPMGNQSITMKMGMEYTLKVLDVDSSDLSTLEMKVSRMEMDMNMGPGMPGMKFDSSKEEDIKRLESMPQFAPLAGILKLNITIKLDKAGRIQDVKGLPAEGGEGAGSMDKSTLQEIFIGFPMGPVSKGANWTKNMMRNMGNMPMEVQATYTLKDIAQHKGKKSATIESKEKIKIDLKGNPMLQGMKVNEKKAEGGSTIIFNLEDGRIASQEGKMELEMGLEGNMGGQQINMEYKIKAVTKVELIQ